jgi:hypothetical protein
MRLYGAIQKVETQGDGTVRVHGIASSEVMDDQGEIVKAEAMRAAIPDYMRFPALREMHQLSAAGTTLEAEIGDDGVTRIVAHVVDPVAVSKVKNQVYRGFSIGGQVTQREPGNPKVITALVLNEISLVDRPANPAAIFDCWKAAAVPDAPCCPDKPAAAPSSSPGPAREPFNPPVQIWACGVPDHQHRGKGDAIKCIERRALGAAADTHLSPAAQAALTSSPADGQVSDSLSEGWREPVYADLGIADFLRAGNPDMQKFAAGRLGKAKLSQGDQALADMALYGCNKCMKIDGLSAAEQVHMAEAADRLRSAGAASSSAAMIDPADSDTQLPAQSEPVPASRGNRRRAHQDLMDIAHDCISKLSDRAVCTQPTPDPDSEPGTDSDADISEAAKAGARHSAETLEQLRSAHSHLVAAGAQCKAGPGGEEPRSSDLMTEKAARAADLVKALAGERAENAVLIKALGEIVPLLDRLTKRVDDIARTPLPPLTMARGSVSVSKQQDGLIAGSTGDARLSPEAIAAAFAKMSKEEQTLTLIKASYANPIRVIGSAASED